MDPQHKAIRRNPRINWIVKPVHKVRYVLIECVVGSADVAFSIVNREALQLQARSLEDWVRGINSIRLQLEGGRHGSVTTPSHTGDIVSRNLENRI